MLNHSATHLLHAALRKVLGPHVIQKARWSHRTGCASISRTRSRSPPQELETIEQMVNAEIRRNAAGHIRHMPYDDAIQSGAMALFGEKYGDEVRVLSFGDFSTELCGGTHVGRTGDIGLFKITGEGGIASGIRRIEAVTGEGALESCAQDRATLKRVAGSLRATPAELEGKVAQLLEQQKKLEREISALRAKLASGGSADLAAQAVKINGVSVLAAKVEGADAQSLRDAADQYRSKLGDAVVVLGAQVADDKVSLVASVSPAYLEQGERGCFDRPGREDRRRTRRRAAGFRASGRKRPVQARRRLAGSTGTDCGAAGRNLVARRQSEVTWGGSRFRCCYCSPRPSRLRGRLRTTPRAAALPSR